MASERAIIVDRPPESPPNRLLMESFASDGDRSAPTVKIKDDAGTSCGGIAVDIFDVVFAKCQCRNETVSDGSDACYYVLAEEVFEDFVNDLGAEIDDQQTVDEIVTYLKNWKRYDGDHPTQRELELLCKFAFTIGAPPRDVDTSEEEIQGEKAQERILQAFHALSKEILETHFDGEIDIFRGVRYDLGKLGEQLLNAETVGEYTLATNTIVSTTINEDTAAAYSPILFRKSIPPTTVLVAIDLLFWTETAADAGDPEYLTEGELLLNGDELYQLDPSQVYAWELDQPLHKLLRALEAGTLNPKQHAAMAELVTQLVQNTDGQPTLRADLNLNARAQDRIDEWFTAFDRAVADGELSSTRYTDENTRRYLHEAVTAITDESANT